MAAGRQEHFGRAAESLGITQPAVSQLVRDLESELRVSLFERLPRGVRLTSAGKAYLKHVENILAGLERAAEHARQLGGGASDFLRVRFSPVSATTNPIMQQAVATFRSQHPGVKLDLMQMRSSHQVPAIRAGAIDAGFLYMTPNDATGLKHFHLREELAMLALPRNHRLANRKVIELADLSEESFVWYSGGGVVSYYEQLLSACASRGFLPRVVQEMDSTWALLSFVSAGLGIAVVNSSHAERPSNGVIFKPFKDLDLKFSLNLAWLDTNVSPALRSFVDIVRDTFLSAATNAPQARAKRSIQAREASATGSIPRSG